MSFQQVQVLLIEGDNEDASHVRLLLQGDQTHIPLTHVPDGKIALARLCGNDGYPRLPRPYIILLALPLIGMSTFTFLHHLRADPELRPSRVFMLADAADELDKARAYGQHIVGYILKSALRQRPDAFRNLLYGYAAFVELMPKEN